MRATIALGALILAMGLTLAGAARAEPAPQGYDAARLYNLGNAYARAGQPGLAALSYERARLLAPNDKDIEINLRRVRESAHASPEAAGALGALRISDPLWVAGSGIAGLMFISLSGLARRRKIGARSLAMSAAAIGLALLGLLVSNAVGVWPKLHAAVVIAPQTTVRVAPVPLGEALFVLPEAESVVVSAEHEGFLFVRTVQGRAGWVAQASVAPIVPRN